MSESVTFILLQGKVNYFAKKFDCSDEGNNYNNENITYIIGGFSVLGKVRLSKCYNSRVRASQSQLLEIEKVFLIKYGKAMHYLLKFCKQRFYHSLSLKSWKHQSVHPCKIHL